MLLTIFTPTYNRAYSLERLYKSLVTQSLKDFEWLVVDDGSTDNTEELINKFVSDNKVKICYFKQENGGKHRAINRGAAMAQGDYFLIVDSDDYLTSDAVESIKREWIKVCTRSDISGICFRKINYSTNEIIGKAFPKDKLFATTFDIYYNWKIRGDKAEVFRTSLIRKNPFPEISGERFMTETYVWNKIAGHRKSMLYCINQGIYMCDYLPDGLTANFKCLLRNNPKGYIKYYSSLLGNAVIWRHPIDILKISIRLCQSIYYCLL